MKRLLFISLVVIWLALGGALARAQEQPDLTVTLHDVANTPLIGVNVIVRDTSGTRDLARAATDAQGAASFANLAERAVRVAVAGALPGGARLYQPGNDAMGVSVWLDGGPTRIDLRSTADGLVAPDPATMAALEPGVPVATAAVAFPTAPIASPLPAAQATVSLPVAAPVEVAPVVATSPQEPPTSVSPSIWLGITALIMLLVAGFGIVLVQRRAA